MISLETDCMNPEQIEIEAMRGNPLPGGCGMPEMMLYGTLRAMHQSVRSGQLSREDAHTEKVALLQKYDEWKRWEAIYRDTCVMRVGLARVAKEMTTSDCPLCRKAIAIIDGRETEGNK